MDVQRDHVWMIKQAMGLLSPEGTLIFSTNYRKFMLDEKVKQFNQVLDISPKTIDRDFSRNKRIHYCFEIKHQPDNQ